MPKITISLKQHTPIIHFQSDRDYATIRATELKPKLDKFLKEKRPDLPFNEKGALDYKVQITTTDHDTKPIPERYPLYFGGMGAENQINPKKFVFSKKPIDIKMFSYHADIIEAIEKYSAEFFMKTTFGTRQSKGFGSFYIGDNQEFYKNPVLRYKFTVNVNNNSTLEQSWNKLFSNINLFYNSLRAGINLPHIPFYFKSMMFLYFKDKDIRWDKRSIKGAFFLGDIPIEQRKHPIANGPIIWDQSAPFEPHNILCKDLLGLSTSETWRRGNQNFVITKEHADDLIMRFKSPIYFKPIKTQTGYDVWFDADLINPLMGSQLFKIKKDGKDELKLVTPDLEEEDSIFDIHDFIHFAVNQNLAQHVESTFHRSDEFGALKRIYGEIAANLNGGVHEQ